MNKEDILAIENVPLEWWDDCYIADNGMIFAPSFDDDDNIITTGMEVYEKWLSDNNVSSYSPRSKSAPPPQNRRF